MKIAIIGLGHIAQKAYLPIITNKPGIKPVFVTRNQNVLQNLAEKYRVNEYYNTVDELAGKNIAAAFVHSSTESHFEIVSKLLDAGIHVYVDKPLSYSFEESAALAKLAEKGNKLLFVGFNRRYAPMYKSIKEKSAPQIIIMQKNRINTPGETRKFVLDDFIHVIDTVRFLSPGNIKIKEVESFRKDKILTGISVLLSGDSFSATAIMNRDSGANEEILEVMEPGVKWSVKNLNETIVYKNGGEKIVRFNDWDYVLYRRGFVQITDHFIELAGEKNPKHSYIKDALITHDFCEQVIDKLGRV